MTHYDFLYSEWLWCISQYQLLGYESYMARAMAIEVLISEYNENKTGEYQNAS